MFNSQRYPRNTIEQASNTIEQASNTIEQASNTIEQASNIIRLQVMTWKSRNVNSRHFSVLIHNSFKKLSSF